MNKKQILSRFVIHAALVALCVCGWYSISSAEDWASVMKRAQEAAALADQAAQEAADKAQEARDAQAELERLVESGASAAVIADAANNAIAAGEAALAAAEEAAQAAEDALRVAEEAAALNFHDAYELASAAGISAQAASQDAEAAGNAAKQAGQNSLDPLAGAPSQFPDVDTLESESYGEGGREEEVSPSQ